MDKIHYVLILTIFLWTMILDNIKMLKILTNIISLINGQKEDITVE